MPHLFLIPEWITFVIFLLLPLWLLSSGKSKKIFFLGMVILFTFDGLNTLVGNTSINALKLGAIASLILLPLLSPNNPKYFYLALLYPIWLILRDLI